MYNMHGATLALVWPIFKGGRFTEPTSAKIGGSRKDGKIMSSRSPKPSLTYLTHDTHSPRSDELRQNYTVMKYS